MYIKKKVSLNLQNNFGQVILWFSERENQLQSGLIWLAIQSSG